MVSISVQAMAAGVSSLRKPPSGLLEGLWLWVLRAHKPDLEKSQPEEAAAAQDSVWVGVFEGDNYWERQENIYPLL